MFGIGIPELILILIVGLIVFGPSRLPEVGRAVGKGLREFKKASNALSAAIDAPDEPPVRQSAPPATPAPEKLEATKNDDAKKDAPPQYEPPTQESVKAQIESAKENA